MNREELSAGVFLMSSDNSNILVIQKICLEIYNAFQNICEKHGLRYFGIGGTAIGAVRHYGFIPWDDDMDIAMPYSDLEQFIAIAKNELDKAYEIYSPLEHKHYHLAIIKICKKNTTFIESNVMNYPDSYRGIGIDIMPLFGLPKNKIAQWYYAKKCDVYVRANLVLHAPLSLQDTIWGKTAWVLQQPVKTKLIESCFWIKRIIKEYSELPFDKSEKILFGWRTMRKKGSKSYYDSVFDYDDFRTYVELKFEDTVMRVPIGYDRYLSHDFGDYMTLPPVEQRISNHETEVIDFYRSYKDYID